MKVQHKELFKQFEIVAAVIISTIFTFQLFHFDSKVSTIKFIAITKVTAKSIVRALPIKGSSCDQLNYYVGVVGN